MATKPKSKKRDLNSRVRGVETHLDDLARRAHQLSDQLESVGYMRQQLEIVTRSADEALTQSRILEEQFNALVTRLALPAAAAPRAAPVWNYISTIVPQASALTAVSGVITDVATLTVPAGDWIIEGELWFRVTAGTPTVSSIATVIGPDPGTNPTDPTDNVGIHRIEPQQAKQAGTTVGVVLPLTGVRANLSGSTAYYLTANIVWTGTATILLYGKLSARSQTTSTTTQAPPVYSSGRWIQRDGNIYGRYTYEGTAPGQLDPQLRRSPPATE